MSRKIRGEIYDSNLPEPKLDWRDGKPFITDGWIMGSRIIIKKQPSIETIQYINGIFVKQAIKAEQKAKKLGLTLQEYINSKKKEAL